MTDAVSRRTLFRWLGWFAMANAGVLALIGLRYFSGYSPSDSWLAWLYLMTVYIAHHVMLAVIPLFLVVAPVVLVWPRKRVVMGLSVIVFALMIAVIMLDSLLWQESRFHLNTLTMKILGWQSWVFTAVILTIGLFFQSMLAGRVWDWVVKGPVGRGLQLALASVLCVVISQSIHAWADASYFVPVTSAGQQLPVYKGITAKKQLTRWGLVDPQKSREREVARRLARDLESTADQVLNYPLAPVQCEGGGKNVLLILADAMRSDMLGEEESPNLTRYAREQGQRFNQHFSGGNSSRMGVFSLFYGLPPGYWSSFESLQRSAVLIDEFQNQGYQLGLFSSSTMYRPVTLDRTAFANVQNLRLATEPASDPAWKRDQKITGEWMDWLDSRKKEQPFFGFLFYDATNNITFPDDYPQQFESAGDSDLEEKFADYRTAVHFVDDLISQVLDDLKQRGLDQDTVVVISSDHGEEFDESGAGLTDHGSGYTRYQLQVPLVISIPGRAPAVFDHRSSHYDLVPTLMEEVLGCTSPSSDYASGTNLFDQRNWDWLLAGSYYNYAVLEPDQVTITYPNGRFEVRDWNYRIAEKPVISGTLLESVAKENSRFYRR